MKWSGPGSSSHTGGSVQGRAALLYSIVQSTSTVKYSTAHYAVQRVQSTVQSSPEYRVQHSILKSPIMQCNPQTTPIETLALKFENGFKMF